MWRLSKLKLLLASMAALFVFAVVPTVAANPVTGFGAVNAKNAICEGVSASGGSSGCSSSGGVSLSKIVKVVLNILSIVAAIIAVIMIVVSGLKFMTSGGNASDVASARNTLLYAIVGIIIVVFAQIIVRFVLKQTA